MTAYMVFLKILHNTHPRLVRERVCFRGTLHPGIRAIAHGHKVANVYDIREVVCNVTHSVHYAVVLEVHGNDVGLEDEPFTSTTTSLPNSAS
jgi:hypothetical protein